MKGTPMQWSELHGRTIKKVLSEGDSEWAKQNGLETNIYLILDDGTSVTLSIKEDNGSYIAIDEN